MIFMVACLYCAVREISVAPTIPTSLTDQFSVSVRGLTGKDMAYALTISFSF